VKALAGQPDLVVCGEAADAATALRAPAPDLAVVDMGLGIGRGVNLVKAIAAPPTAARVLVWSVHANPLYADWALRSGARGFVTKRQPPATLVAAIRQALDGKTYLSDDVAAVVRKRPAGHPPNGTLSEREAEVLRHLGQGHGTERISAAMGISPRTVSTYRDRLKEKLGLQSTTELVMWAVLGELENAGPPRSLDQ
jgi:DNA-binding NarL/FixJ family response regulator